MPNPTRQTIEVNLQAAGQKRPAVFRCENSAKANICMAAVLIMRSKAHNLLSVEDSFM